MSMDLGLTFKHIDQAELAFRIFLNLHIHHKLNLATEISKHSERFDFQNLNAQSMEMDCALEKLDWKNKKGQHD